MTFRKEDPMTSILIVIGATLAPIAVLILVRLLNHVRVTRSKERRLAATRAAHALTKPLDI